MSKIFNNKRFGFYFITLATILGIISTVRFLIWAPAHNTMNTMILGALILGIVSNIVLHFYDNDFLVILSTACYALAGAQLFADSTGSFVDAYQGIVMFGDSSQVGTVISLGSMMLISSVLSIIAAFTNRVKA